MIHSVEFFKISVNELAQRAKTGDLLLISGKGNIGSRVIELASGSEFSHVGVIIRAEQTIHSEEYVNPKSGTVQKRSFSVLPNSPPLERLMFFHSSSPIPNTYDIITGLPPTEGVQLIPLEAMLKNYGEGSFYYRPLAKNHQVKSDWRWLLLHLRKVVTTPYEYYPVTMFNSVGYDWCNCSWASEMMDKEFETNRSLFCSELVVHFYAWTEVIPYRDKQTGKRILYDKYDPNQFAIFKDPVSGKVIQNSFDSVFNIYDNSRGMLYVERDPSLLNKSDSEGLFSDVGQCTLM